MNKEDYKQSIKDEVRSVEVAGKIHYYRVPGYLDVDLFSIMKSDEPENVKEMKILCGLICDESGKRIFDSKNEEHIHIISMLPANIITPMMEALYKDVFPGELKAQD